MNRIIEEQKKRIRYMYTWMFRRYRTNTLADGGSISDKPVLGPELIPDASRWFNIDNDPYWGKSTGVVVSGGICQFTNVTRYEGLSKMNLLTNGKFYVLTLTISNITSGGVFIYCGTPDSIATITVAGTYTYTVQSNSASRGLYINASAAGSITTLQVDNISVREVLINSVTTDYLKMAQKNRMDKSIRFGWLGEAGSKITSGKVEKAYSFDFNNYQNNATQTTPANRPYLTGNIAPNEKLGLKNPNGGSNYMTHPTISFAANEAWSITTVFNWNYNAPSSSIWGWEFDDSNGCCFRLLSDNNTNKFRLINVGTSVITEIPYNTSSLIGKNKVLTVVGSNGILLLYLDGVLIYTSTYSANRTAITINSILKGRAITSNSIIKSHIIRSQALTQAQVTAEYNYLRSVYPEIESVDIGTQTWASSNCEMAATPQGNVIQEMQAAANVEKIVNVADREFSSDTGFWTKGTGVTIADGVCHIVNGSGNLLTRSSLLTVGKYYKITETVANYVSGSYSRNTWILGAPTISSNGTYIYYGVATGSGAISLFTNNSATLDLDNVSVQEIGWSGSQELYDGIYAQTAGTVEQKTYAAVKAAGFWRNCQTTVDSGALYGKEYNKFAALLLKMDIDYYNIANPTTLWGYRVPLRADLTTLAAYGGNALKLSGNTYWNTANGTNATGFSALGSGIVNADGTNSVLKANTYLLCSDANFAREIKDGDDTCNEVAITTQGGVIRLIKV